MEDKFASVNWQNMVEEMHGISVTLITKLFRRPGVWCNRPRAYRIELYKKQK